MCISLRVLQVHQPCLESTTRPRGTKGAAPGPAQYVGHPLNYSEKILDEYLPTKILENSILCTIFLDNLVEICYNIPVEIKVIN